MSTRAQITVGPFSCFFTNVNTRLQLPGHSHFAIVTLTYRTLGPLGFPAFADTYAAIQAHLQAVTARVFREMTNEDIANALWAAFVDWTDPTITHWGGDFALARMDFAVRGVPDRIGHADGFTTYTVEAGD